MKLTAKLNLGKISWTNAALCVLAVLLAGSVQGLLSGPASPVPPSLYSTALKNAVYALTGVNLFFISSTVAASEKEATLKRFILIIFFSSLFLQGAGGLFHLRLGVKACGIILYAAALALNLLTAACGFKLNRVSGFMQLPALIYFAAAFAFSF